MCWSSACVFPLLIGLGGQMQSWTLLWQPVIVGCLFVAGQWLTLMAVERGDVSIAAPVLGIKVLIVPAVSPLFVDTQVATRVWVAAAIAVVGIACVQSRDAAVQRSQITASVIYASLAACCMTLFDLFIQRWAPVWGAGYFLPMSFACSAVVTLVFLGRLESPSKLRQCHALRPLLMGACLMAVQAIGMTLTIGLFGDATRVNIVYSLRGLWGVLMTWILAHHIHHSETVPSHRTMSMRLLGAVLIAISVVISVT